MERILGPDVYTYQNDLSAPPSAPESVGCAFIGPFVKGPALIPQYINSAPEYYKRYGYTNVNFYTPYAVDQYLKYNQSLYCARTLWEQGYKADALVLYTTGSATGLGNKNVVAVLTCTSKNTGVTANSFDSYVITTGSGNGATLTTNITASSVINGTTYSVAKSLSYTNISNLQTIFSTDPKQVNTSVYLSYYDKDLAIACNSASVQITGSLLSNAVRYTSSATKIYNHAVTPWVVDQNGTEIFRIHSLSDGDYSNTQLKIAISDIKTSSIDYTTFNVLVRAYTDTDQRPSQLQGFYTCNLDPDSDNYIEKVIGNKYSVYDETTQRVYSLGDYVNKSSYIRVQVASHIAKKLAVVSVYPNGFKPVPFPVFLGATTTPATNYNTSSANPFKTTTSSTYEYFGWNFSSNISKYFLTAQSELASTGSTAMSNFTLTTGQTKMILPMYGGFDGTNHGNLYTNDANHISGFDMTAATSSGSVIYKKVIDILSDGDAYDIEVLSLPGIDISGVGKKAVYDYADDMIQNDLRQDLFLPGQAAYQTQMDVNAVAAKTANYDTNYGAVYYPWGKYYDRYLKKYVMIPVSTLLPAVYAYNDLVQHPWYAPAGLNRGILNIIQPKIRLNKTDRGLLYDNRINPIAVFPGEGPAVWGQKTLQKDPSALDRINVRRLLIRLKKYAVKVGRSLAFDPNTVTLRNTFLGILNPYFDMVVSKNGLYSYEIIMDESNNTATLIDRNQLRGQISIRPTKAAQKIIIPFNILGTENPQ